MSLDFYLTATTPTTVCSENITHNMGKMARALGVYECLWHPGDHGFIKASQITPLLEKAIAELENSPENYVQYNPENGWGNLEGFLGFLKNVHGACVDYPDGEISVWI